MGDQHLGDGEGRPLRGRRVAVIVVHGSAKRAVGVEWEGVEDGRGLGLEDLFRVVCAPASRFRLLGFKVVAVRVLLCGFGFLVETFRVPFCCDFPEKLTRRWDDFLTA